MSKQQRCQESIEDQHKEDYLVYAFGLDLGSEEDQTVWMVIPPHQKVLTEHS